MDEHMNTFWQSRQRCPARFKITQAHILRQERRQFSEWGSHSPALNLFNKAILWPAMRTLKRDPPLFVDINDRERAFGSPEHLFEPLK